MTRLSEVEFRAMNNPFRRLVQKYWEFPLLKRLGVTFTDKDVLEIGCGSGYGAMLIMAHKPRSYLGIDVMPEQIDLARRRHIPDARFELADSTQLNSVADESVDLVIIFGVLHHIPEWNMVLKECCRILRDKGELYAEEPGSALMAPFERWFKWGHPQAASFRLSELEAAIQAEGFEILRRFKAFGFGFYRVKLKDRRTPNR